MSNFDNSKTRVGFHNLRQMPGFNMNGVVSKVHLHQAFGTEKEQYLNTGMAQIWASNDRYHGKPLVGMTEAQGKCVILNRPTYRWELIGGRDEVVRIVKVKCIDPKPGQFNRTFEVAVDKQWWSVSDVVSPNDEGLRFLVKPADGSVSRTVRTEGVNCFIYTLQIISDSPVDYCPPQFLQIGSEWQRVSSGVADEGNKDGGGFHFYSIFETSNHVQQHTKKIALTEGALRRINQAQSNIPGVDVPDDLGGWTKKLWVDLEGDLTAKPLSAFMSVMEAKMMDALYEDVENTLMFGKKATNTLRSPEGYLIRFASGLREQLEQGYVLEYNENMPLEQFEEWFESIMKDKIAEGKRRIVLSSGLQFRKLFDKMLKQDAKSFTTLDTLYIRKGSTLRDMAFGAYFAEYVGFTVDIIVMENPAYDNKRYSLKKHPIHTDTPISSWRADILDFGTAEAQGSGTSTDNICMVSESYLNYNLRTGGKYDPISLKPITNGGVAIAGNLDGIEILTEKSAGLWIKDITRCGVVRLDDSGYFS